MPFLTIDAADLERCRRDPRTKAFAAASARYWQRAKPRQYGGRSPFSID